MTPLCSQVTYEGLLDDTFGIQCGVVEFDKEVTGTDKSIKLPVNSSDEVSLPPCDTDRVYVVMAENSCHSTINIYST